jgi:hypothetical protein
LRAQPVKRWIKQQKRSVAVVEHARKSVDAKIAGSIAEKIDNIGNHLLLKFENQFLPEAEWLEGQRHKCTEAGGI